MTDKELLDLAAKAVGLTPAADSDQEWVDDGQGGVTGQFEWKDAEGGELLYHWNPLTDDGDALRLAVKTGEPFVVRSRCVTTMGGLVEDFDPAVSGDDLRATRRAIVRAAAAIGEKMP